MPKRQLGTSIRRWSFYGIVFVLIAAFVLALLFVINGTFLGHGETPLLLETHHSAVRETDPRVIKILAYNIAKCFVYSNDGKFASREDVINRLDRIAALINQEKPDLVFLSEAVNECSPCDVNQVKHIAEATGMHCWVLGENYNFGLPFYRIIGGNAILSRWPLVAESNPSLVGRQPFYVIKNNRRVLWCRISFTEEEILLGAIHTDSFNIDNNLRQTRQILNYCADRPTILAGDFNANPDEPSIKVISASEAFAGNFNPPKTFPSNDPDQTLDYIFAPAHWRLVDYRVLAGTESDHLAVVSTFVRPEKKAIAAE
jgi:endonuclease/exonuclease/phosphatase family metal-dependent hydrolase